MSILFSVFLFLCTLISAEAAPLQPGLLYQGPTSIEVQQYRFSFELPSGWLGILPEGTDAFVIAQSQNDNNKLIMSVVEGTQADMEQQLETGFPIDASLFLKPSGAIKRPKKEQWERNFSIDNYPQIAAFVHVQKLSSQAFLASIALTSQQDQPIYKKTIDFIISSISIIESPPEPRVPSGEYASRLRDRKLYKFYSGSGYSEKETISLCGEGWYKKGFSSSSNTMNGYGSSVSRGDGSWHTQGNQLILTANDGSVYQYEIQFDGNKLYLNGKRWLKESYGCN